MSASTDKRPDAPFCMNCGYNLTGLTDSSKCPECGRPLVEVLGRPSQFALSGRRWRSRATLLGWPVIDIAFGPYGAERRGVAKGIIAIGDVAIGGVAVGGASIGVVAMGGVAAGGLTLGGCSVGALSAFGGLAVGMLAAGGMAVGGWAIGGQAIGGIAVGGLAVGIYAHGARGFNTPEAKHFFETTWLLFGMGLPAGALMFAAFNAVMTILIGIAIAGVALLRAARDGWAKQER